MNAPEVYLDHNASAPLLPAAATAWRRVAALGPGNPSSAHASGRRLRKELEDAREAVARLVGARPEEVVFTSGATESNALALHGAAAAAGGGQLVGSEADHASVTGVLDELSRRGNVVERAGVDAHGRSRVADLERLAAGAIAVTLPHACSVTGALQPVGAVRESTDGVLHVDAAQTPGRLDVRIAELGADLLTLSGHKIGAPVGIGALVVRAGAAWRPPWGDGSQERGRRPGTVAVALAAAFGAAAEHVREHREERVAAMTTTCRSIRAGLEHLDGVQVVTPGTDALPNTCLAVFDGCPGEAVAAALDGRGIRVSTGSACTSGARLPPPVLLAGGWARDRAATAVRISTGPDTSDADVRTLLDALADVVPRVRAALGAG